MTTRLMWCVLALLSALGYGSLANAQAASVTLAWDAPVIGEEITGYNLYRMTGLCTSTVAITAKVGTVPFPAVTMGDTVPGNGTYCYELTAFNTGGESDRSNRAQAVVSVKPTPRKNLKVIITVTP